MPRPPPLSFDGPDPAGTPDATLALEPRLVHARTGIIRALGTPMGDSPDADIAIVSATVSRRVAIRLSGARAAAAETDVIGTGVAEDPRIARARAIGEAVERYALVVTQHRRFERAAYRDVREEAVAPPALAAVSDAERAGRPQLAAFDESEPIEWAWATRVVASESVRVPAGCVWRGAGLGGSRLTPLLPHGSACGNSLAEAAQRALGEALERDALMTMWLLRRPPPRVRPESVRGRGFHAIRDALAARGLALTLHDMTSDLGYPAFCTTLVDRSGGGPALAMGTGAGFDAEAAALRAAEEAVHMRARWRLLRQTGSPVAAHYRWAPVDALSAASFLLDAAREVELPRADAPRGARARLDATAALLAKAGLDPLVVDITPPDVAPLGLRVAAALVAGLVPKSPWPTLVHAATPRLGGVAPADFNAMPVPYP